MSATNFHRIESHDELGNSVIVTPATGCHPPSCVMTIDLRPRGHNVLSWATEEFIGEVVLITGIA